MPNFIDLRGQRFGRWTVLYRAPDRRRGYPEWRCKCDCGNEGTVRANILRSGQSRSCGCLNVDVHRQVCLDRNTTHGRSKTPAFNCWVNIVQRCTNPNASGYAKYGARGIGICSRWRESFEDFLADMGERPAGKTIDRIDNSKGYEPGNCRWVSMKVQQNNRTNNRLLTYKGKTLTVAQWADITGISHRLIGKRLDKLGWSIEDALSKAVRPWGPGKPL